MKCGGTTATRDPNPEDRNVALSVRSAVEEQTGQKGGKFDVLKVATQVVAGVNYFMKILTENNEVVHIRAYKDLGGNISLTSLQRGKTVADELAYF